jgi:hypothetical protein
LKNDLNIRLAENDLISKENIELKESNIILLQIKTSKEKIEKSLKETESKLWQVNENHNEQLKQFYDEKLE